MIKRYRCIKDYHPIVRREDGVKKPTDKPVVEEGNVFTQVSEDDSLFKLTYSKEKRDFSLFENTLIDSGCFELITTKPFDNAERNRYYGIRIGDIVEERAFGVVTKGEVMGYGLMDNNKVYINTEGDITLDAVAEWCDIITKVEDRTDRFKEMNFLMVTDKNGYLDYEIKGFFYVHRACVHPNIKVGDIFNVYHDDSSKCGVEWKGDLKTSLIESEVCFHNVNV